MVSVRCPFCKAVTERRPSDGSRYCNWDCYSQDRKKQAAERVAARAADIAENPVWSKREPGRVAYLRAYRQKRWDDGICQSCKEPRLEDYALCAACEDRRLARCKRLRAAEQERILDAYGHACACCGERERLFLTVDHVNNDGAEHRKTFNGDLYKWLIRQGFPDGFQILCFNCNMGKYRNGGVCPHHQAVRLAAG